MSRLGTGPADKQDDAQEWAALENSRHWKALLRYLTRAEAKATSSLKKTGLTQEMGGYYRGVLSIIGDVKSLPDNAKRQLQPQKAPNTGDYY